MNEREQLKAALTEAEAELARAVAAHARAYPGALEADAELDRARAHCRQLRAALDELSRAREARPQVEPQEKPIESPKMQTARLSGPPAKVGRLLRALPWWPAGAHSGPAWRTLARQALMLIALIAAYLQYYFLDVQLQVSRLPSVFE